MTELALNRITNYQTSFVIDSRPPKESFGFICNKLIDWIERHEIKLSREFNKKKFRNQVNQFFEGKMDVRFPSYSSLKTEQCVCEDRLLWGMEYIHKECSKKTRMMVRLWHTEVFMTSFFNNENTDGVRDKLVVFIKISYSWNRNKLLEETDAVPPQPTAPGFIYDLLTLHPHQDGLDYAFGKNVKVIESEKDGEQLWNFINSSQRRIHILLIVMQVYETDTAKNTFLLKLGSRIVGKTFAFLVRPASPAYKALRAAGLDIKSPTAYICPPSQQGDTRPQYLQIPNTATADVYNHLNERLCQFFYRNYFYVEDDAIVSLEQIRFELLKQNRKRMIAAHSAEIKKAEEDSTRNYDALTQKHNDLKAAYEILETEWLDEDTRRIQAEEALKKTKEDLKESYRKRDTDLERWQRERKELQNAKAGFMEAEIISASCNNLSDRLKPYIALLSDRLVFTEKALKSLEECPKEMERYILGGLFVLYSRFWPAFSSPEGIGDRSENLVNDLIFGYTPNEGALTKSNAKFTQERTVFYNNKKIVCHKHLKLKRDDGRIYFEYDSQTQRIILCSIGKHLTTAGTQRRSK